MEEFSNEHPELVLDIHFEEMKMDPTACVKKVAVFLHKELTDDTVKTIAEKCSFKNLKAADEILKNIPDNLLRNFSEEHMAKMKKYGFIPFFRKGIFVYIFYEIIT